ESAIEISALHGATHDDVVAAPGVIGAVAVGLVGAAEIRQREAGNIRRHAHLHGRLVERAQRLVQVVEEGILLRKLAAVGVESSHGYEEDLSPQTEGQPYLNNLRHLLQLAGEIRVLRKLRGQRRSAGER